MSLRQPIAPDALMIRELADGYTAVVRVPEHRMGVYLQGGWTLLISESQIKSINIEDVRQADEDRFKRE